MEIFFEVKKARFLYFSELLFARLRQFAMSISFHFFLKEEKDDLFF